MGKYHYMITEISDKMISTIKLKIDEDNLAYASFVDSSQLMLGQDAIAIGNPLGLSCEGCDFAIQSHCRLDCNIGNI